METATDCVRIAALLQTLDQSSWWDHGTISLDPTRWRGIGGLALAIGGDAIRLQISSVMGR